MFSQSTSVNYAQQQANYNTTVSNSGSNFNSGGNQIGFWANGSGSNSNVVSWRPLTTDGSTTSGNRRTLQIGDQFTIAGSFARAYGEIGIALLSSPSSEASFADRINNYALQVNLDGPDVTGSGYANWYVKGAGIATNASFGGNQTTYHDFIFTFTLTAPDRMNVSITDNTASLVYNVYDVQLNNTNITDYAVYLQDDWDGASHQNAYWGLSGGANTSINNTGAVSIGASNNTFAISGVIADALYANQNSGSTYSNTLTKVGSGTVTLTGTNTYTGLTTVSAGTLKLNHSGGGTLPSTNNIMNNGGTSQISSNQTLTNITNVGGGILLIDNGVTLITNGRLYNTSGTVTNNGSLVIAPNVYILGDYSTITGTTTLQQSIVAQRGWRIFANPFSTAQTLSTVASTNGITIHTTASSNAANIGDDRIFDNTTSNAWADGGASIASNKAYGLFIRGLASEVTGLVYTGGPSPFTYSVSGTLNGNTVSYNSLNTSNFFVVGNPYAAPVNSQALTGGVSGLNYFTYQIAVTGTPRVTSGSWVASGTTSDATHTIPVLGAIAFQPTVTSYSISNTDINGFGTLQTGLFGAVPPSSQIELLVEQNGYYADKLFVRLDPNATISGKDRADLLKLYNDNVNVYTIGTTDNTRMAIDARNTLSSIPLGISGLAGTYNFKLNSNNLPEGTTVILNDKLLNTQTELKVGDVYSFSITSDASTYGEQRFELLFSAKNTVTPTADATNGLKANVLGNIAYGNIVAVEITGATAPVIISIRDINGKAIGLVNATNGIQYVNIGNSAKGMLLLQISDGKSSTIKKVMKL